MLTFGREGSKKDDLGSEKLGFKTVSTKAIAELLWNFSLGERP